MNVIPLARSRYGAAKASEAEAEVWKIELAAFPDAIRSKAANLAAHSWDVTLIDGRVLISCAWYNPGHQGFWDREGGFTPLTLEQMDALYPELDPPLPRPKGTSELSKTRSLTIHAEGLAALAGSEGGR